MLVFRTSRNCYAIGMSKNPKRDDRWNGIDPVFARLVNDPETAEHERASSRVVWLLALITGALIAGYLSASWYWGEDPVVGMMRVGSYVGGGLIVAAFVVLCVLAIFQKKDR